MMHDKRDGDGKYRILSNGEARVKAAKEKTQTHEGRFTHERDAAERRMSLDIDLSYSTPRFKNQKVNREAYHPKVTK